MFITKVKKMISLKFFTINLCSVNMHLNIHHDIQIYALYFESVPIYIFQKSILKQRELEAKWKNVPEWKRALLMKKDMEVYIYIL